MNYNVQGITKKILELFENLAKVEIKKEYQVLMVNKITSFKKNGKQVVSPVKKPKAEPKREAECFYCKGNGHWKWNYPKYLADKKDGKVNKGIFDIHVIDVYLTSSRSSPWVFDTCSVAKISNTKQEL